MFNFICPICHKEHKNLFFKLILSKNNSQKCSCGSEIEFERFGWAMLLFILIWFPPFNWIIIYLPLKFEEFLGFELGFFSIIYLLLASVILIVLICKFICKYKVIPANKIAKLSKEKEKIFKEYKSMQFDKMSDKEVAEIMLEYFKKLELDCDEILLAELRYFYFKRGWSSERIENKIKEIDEACDSVYALDK